MKLFEAVAPTGQIVRRWSASLAALQADLPGYKITGQVIGATANGLGGLVDPIGPGATSIITTLLEDGRGDILRKWLSTHPQISDGIATKAR